jgi:hypothetical protein
MVLGLDAALLFCLSLLYLPFCSLPPLLRQAMFQAMLFVDETGLVVELSELRKNQKKASDSLRVSLEMPCICVILEDAEYI